MTEHNPSNQSGLPEGLPLGALLRAEADGEALSSADRARLAERPEADRAGDDARLDFERSLREAVGQTMGAGASAAAPASLRNEITHALRSDAGPARTQDVVRTSMGDTTNRSFWSGVARFGAIAAVLALVGGLVWTSIQSSPPSITPQRANVLAAFVGQQHEGCSVNGRDFSARNAAEATSLANDHLGSTPSVVSYGLPRFQERGYTFEGMGRCGVPGDQPSVHMFFRSASDATVSLFVQLDPADMRLCDKSCYLRRCKKSGQNFMVVWTQGGFTHYLCSADQDVLDEARAVFKTPDRELALPGG